MPGSRQYKIRRELVREDMGGTKIEWADKVWNPITGCTKINEGCRNCYAERMSKRLAGRYGYPKENPFKVTLHPDKLEPFHWKKPARIFVCSMSDLFHVNVPFAFVDKVVRNIRLSSRHIFLVLTKRPHFMKEYFEQIGSIENLWLGVSVENQKTADERIPLLLQTSATKRFVSYEPAIGPVDFLNIKAGEHATLASLGAILLGGQKLIGLDWIIMGGESGPKARPMHPDWVREVRDQCEAVNVPFFFKQWGEWMPLASADEADNYPSSHMIEDDDIRYVRIGKKAAGCLLDGKEHKEMPRC